MTETHCLLFSRRRIIQIHYWHLCTLGTFSYGFNFECTCILRCSFRCTFGYTFIWIWLRGADLQHRCTWDPGKIPCFQVHFQVHFHMVLTQRGRFAGPGAPESRAVHLPLLLGRCCASGASSKLAWKCHLIIPKTSQQSHQRPDQSCGALWGGKSDSGTVELQSGFLKAFR